MNKAMSHKPPVPIKATDTLPQFSAETLRDICNRIPGVIAVYDYITSKYLYVNDSVTPLLGYKPADFMRGGLVFVSSLIHPDDRKEITRKNKLALEKANNSKPTATTREPIVSFEYRIRHKKGHYVWLHTEGSVFSRKKGRVQLILNISVDVTDSKNAMQQLTKTHTKVETAERFALSQSVAKVGTFEWLLAENRIIWSPETEILYGLKAGSFKGTPNEVQKFIHPNDRPEVSRRVQESLRGGRPFNCEYRIIWPDKSTHWVLGRGKVIRDASGKPIRFIGVNVDISEQKRTEEKLRASEERYQAFIHNSHEAIWRFELDEPIPINLSVNKQIKLMYERGYLAEASLAMAKMYGLRSTKKLVGTRLKDLLIQTDKKNTDYLTAFIKSGYRLSAAESHEVDIKGNDKYFNNSLIGVVEKGFLLRCWGTQQDITEQHKAANKLRKSEERLALALEASKLGIWEWDLISNELFWSPQLKAIFGVKASRDITYAEYLGTLHPDDRAKMQQTIKTALKTGESYQVEHRVVWPDGSLHWVLGQGKAFLTNGKPVRMIGTSLNIDERKKAIELEAITKHLIAEHKLLMNLNAAKDEFISIASHQLRTPATAVKQYLGMLLEGYAGKLSLTDEQMRMITTANESNERQIRIVADLLRVAQIDAGKISLSKEHVDLITLIRQVINDLSKSLEPKKQTIKLEHSPHIFFALVDKSHVRMVIENILDNAIKYSPAKTTIKVSLRRGSKYILIKVSDQGVGIAKPDQKKLFKKFSRIDNPLSMVAGGSGLGLYWAKKIVTLHGGKITVTSKANVGTTFTIKLPSESIS